MAQNVVRSLARHKRRQDERRQKAKLKIGVDIPAREEIAAIITNLKGRWRPLILTAIFTGLRASELRGLRWGDVDLKKRELHVRQRADRFNGIGKPKSAAGERTVPMPPMLANALREWKLACPPSEHELVFPTGAGGIESHSNIVQRGLAPVQMAAGVVTKAGKAKYTGLHSLRHFYASWCINRVEDGGLGLPIKIVQHRLGHASIQMTCDTYGHLFPSGDDGAELAAAEGRCSEDREGLTMAHSHIIDDSELNECSMVCSNRPRTGSDGLRTRQLRQGRLGRPGVPRGRVLCSPILPGSPLIHRICRRLGTQPRLASRAAWTKNKSIARVENSREIVLNRE